MAESLMPTLKAMYSGRDLSYIQEKDPFAKELPSLLDAGIVRPASPCYQQSYSPEIQQALHNALEQSKPDQYRSILRTLQNKLQHFTCPGH
jgi:hypothetical protein